MVKQVTAVTLCSDFSKNLIQSDYFFMSALKGQSMYSLRRKLKPEHVKELKGKINDYLAQLHGIKGDYFGYFTENPDHQFLTWKEGFHHMLHLIVNGGIRQTYRYGFLYGKLQYRYAKHNGEYLP
ncbi:hypothetical protein AMQ84_29810 [Paenibacillus riograndensis]|uniref:Uncharacterized protein n=1 Tax=Paenibacillus riograndensis TaxID=483937 RepID=A0A132TG55_9BACL|nr:hypothetical protein AMQ84_29810 [Paenibacillus riograndensis]